MTDDAQKKKKPVGIGKARARKPQSVAAIKGSSESLLESPWQDAQPKPEDLETPPNMKMTPKRSLSLELRHAKTLELSPSAGEREEEHAEHETGEDDENDTSSKPSGKNEERDAAWWRCNPQIYMYDLCFQHLLGACIIAFPISLILIPKSLDFHYSA